MAPNKHYKPKHQTLCWQCEWAAGKGGKCPWATRFEPVPGWNAKPTKVLSASATITSDGKPQYIDSFDVKECPLFELMTELKRRKAEAEKKVQERQSILQDKDKTYELVERLWIGELKTPEEICEETGLSMWKVYGIIQKIKENWKNERYE